MVMECLKKYSVGACLLTFICCNAYADSPQDIYQSIISAKHARTIYVNGVSEPDNFPYKLMVHSTDIEKLIHASYDKNSLMKIIDYTKDIRKLNVQNKEWGTFIEAASFEDETTANNTHYNAIWLRDSMWGYLALNYDKKIK